MKEIGVVRYVEIRFEGNLKRVYDGSISIEVTIFIYAKFKRTELKSFQSACQSFQIPESKNREGKSTKKINVDNGSIRR